MTQTVKMNELFSPSACASQVLYLATIVLKWGLIKTLYFVFICSAEDLFTFTSNKFRVVYKVDGNPQLDSRD